MIDLPKEIVALAERIAAAQHVSIEDAIRQALEEKARATDIPGGVAHSGKRMSIENMLAVGDEIAAMPLLDPRSAREIMDDLNVL